MKPSPANTNENLELVLSRVSQSVTVKALKNWFWRDRPYFVFVMETMIAEEKLDVVRVGCGFDFCFCFSSNGNSEGMGLWWNDINVSLVSYSTHHIMFEVEEANGLNKWFACGVYGWANHAQKHKTWDLIHSLRNSVHVPCIFFDDFNEILCSAEKLGGAAISERDMKAFRECVDDREFKDLGFRGGEFTWSRGNSPDNHIKERLDRFFAITSRIDLYPHFEVRHLPIYKSNHAPIFLQAGTASNLDGGNKPFKFESFWLSNKECQKVVEESRHDRPGGSIHHRIVECAQGLLVWAN